MIVYPTTTTAVNATTLTATCPSANPFVVGGGYTGIGLGTGNVANTQYTIESYPSASNAWTVSLNVADNSWTVYAVCSK
jgi:hypothetical protein